MIIGKTVDTAGNSLDIDDVQTARQQRKGRNQSGKIQIRFALTNSHASNIPSHEPIETPSATQFEIPKKAKTRAERRSEDEEVPAEVPAEVSFAKSQRRTDFWVVQDTQRINRSRRLKQLETESQFSDQDYDFPDGF
jgi:hypothetical protein